VFWLGATDNGHEGIWTWNATGDQMQYTNWSPAEPNDAGTEHFQNFLLSRIV